MEVAAAAKPGIAGTVAAFVDFGGFQLRNAVQILQGFPSGPRTIPGGICCFGS